MTDPPANRNCLQDSVFLAFLVVLSAASYVHRIGFYSDDWSFLANLTFAEDRSLLGLTRAVMGPHMQMRPVQGLYLSWLYQLFGPDPLGYHVINTAVLAATAVLLYLAFIELRLPRILALAVPAVYALLPHYSTDRFWYAAFQTTLSMALFALCLYADLRAVRDPGIRWWVWRLVSVFALICSILAYEVAIPLFLLNPALAWYLGGILYGSPDRTRPLRARAWVVTAATLVAFIPALLFKVATTTRVGNDDISFPRFVLWLIRRAFRPDFDEFDYGLNVWRAIEVHFGELGLGLPLVVWHSLVDYPAPNVWPLAAVVGLLVFSYLSYAARGSAEALPERSIAWRTIAAGVIVFALGFAIFLSNPNLNLTSTGIGNRTAIAAALGVALVFVGCIGLLTTFLKPTAWRIRLFGGLIALLCAAGSLINGTLGAFWIAAYQAELRVLRAVRADLPSLPPGTQLILDGECPYIGPAIVFESPWDLQAALEVVFRDRTLRGDIVTPRMSVEEAGLRTTIYDQEHLYSYERLLIYASDQRSATWIGSAEEARAYFAARPPERMACPRGEPGIGARVF